jgi:D-xylonolactonase
VDGKAAAFNDCCVDPTGRLITETFFYSPGTNYPLGNLVLLDFDGTARALDGGYHLANGLAFSPDGATLYATDTVLRRIYAYDYDVQRGAVSGKRILVELDNAEGIPDGLTVDTDGNLWSASWYGGCVHCFRSNGTLAGRLPVPAKQVSSVTFGGTDLGALYITTAGQSEQLPVMPRGYDPTTGPFGGALYRARTGAYGLPQEAVAVRFQEVR